MTNSGERAGWVRSSPRSPSTSGHWADLYAGHGLGYDRASQMSRIGAMVRNGIPTSLHSDFTMAPAAPLTLAWVAVNRVTSEGSLMAPSERITIEQALRAVTIDAAFALRMEQEIGSIVAGKRADFTVLEAGPLEVAPMQVKDIPVLGNGVPRASPIR